MNCCTYDCNQGRDCPVRQLKVCPECYGTGYDSSGYDCTCGAKPAAVAKVGKRIHDKTPLRSSAWRVYLKDLTRSILLVMAVMFISAIAVGVMR